MERVFYYYKLFDSKIPISHILEMDFSVLTSLEKVQLEFNEEESKKMKEASNTKQGKVVSNMK